LRFILLSAFLVALCLATVIAVTPQLVVGPIDFEAGDPRVSPANISFAIEMVSADPITRTFVADWYPEIIAPCSSSSNIVADIYVDRGILDSSSLAFSILPPYLPIYQFNLTAFCNSETSISPAFRTTSKLFASEFNLGFPGPAVSSLEGYPFDVYFAQFELYALNHDSGDHLDLNITRVFGRIANFQVTSQMYRTIPNFPWLGYTLRVERPKSIRIYVIMVGIVNWLIAVAFLTISAATLIYRPKKIYPEILLVPVAFLLALLVIRSTFPGAPSSFGTTFDSYTILPVLIILMLCSFFLLLVTFHRRIVEIGQGVSVDQPSGLFVLNSKEQPEFAA